MDGRQQREGCRRRARPLVQALQAPACAAPAPGSPCSRAWRPAPARSGPSSACDNQWGVVSWAVVGISAQASACPTHHV